MNPAIDTPPPGCEPRGAESALEALFREHRKSVLMAAAFVGETGEDARDAVQHAFFMAWLRLNDLNAEPVLNWKTWLRRVAVNHISDQKKASRRVVPLQGFDRADDVPLIDTWISWKHELGDTLGAIHSLTPRQREAFALRFLAGCTTKETAQRMEVDEVTVRNFVAQGRAALKARLTKERDGD